MTELEEHASLRLACAWLGLARASVYRHRGPVQHGPARRPGGGSQPTALSAQEVAQVLAVLNAERFIDKSVEQVWATLLDEGTYLCSVSSMYRILRAHAQVGDRRAQATHPPRAIPELCTDGPDQCWSWDITKLAGPVKGVWYCAYLMLDIFSRKIIHAQVHARETELLARDFIQDAIAANGGVMPDYIHSDNGSPMIGKSVVQLLSDLDITASRSRPHVSNDNPYSEAVNKTLKYAPVFPGRFDSLEHARAFLAEFVTYYNTEHHHSGIGLYTPASVHDGSWRTLRTKRQATLDAAHAAHPHRFRAGPPLASTVPDKAWINRPQINTSTTTHTGAAA